jgi:hypothetical protein
MRGLILALMLAVIAWQPASAQQLLSPSEFRDAAIAALQAADPQVRIQSSGELEVELTWPDGRERSGLRASLGHAYAQYRDNPSAQREIIDGWVQFVVRPSSASRTAENIIALLDARSTLERFADESARTRARSGRPPSPLLWRPFVGDLAEVLAFNGEGGDIQLILAETLSEIGLTAEQAWEAAPRNLRSRLGQLAVSGVPGADRLIYIGGGSGLAPSTLGSGAICSGEAARLAFVVVDVGGYVAGSRDDAVAMSQMRALLDTLRRSGRSLSLTPLGCHNGRVVEITLTD